MEEQFLFKKKKKKKRERERKKNEKWNKIIFAALLTCTYTIEFSYFY